MPYLTKLEDTNGDVYLVLFQRELQPGTILDGIYTNFKVKATKFVDARGKDFAMVTREVKPLEAETA